MPRSGMALNSNDTSVLFGNSPLPMFVIEPSTLQILWVNNSAIRFYCYSVEEFLNKVLTDLHPPDKLESLEKLVDFENNCLKYDGRWVHMKKTGIEIIVEIKTENIIFDGVEATLCVVVNSENSATDFNTILNVEDTVKYIIENSTNLFYIHDTNHVLTYVSPQCREIFDCEPEEAIVNWHTFLTDNPINQIGIELTQTAIDTGIRQPPYILELRTRKGRIIYVEINESPVVVNGKTIAIVGSLNDITEKYMLEQRLEFHLKMFEQLFHNAPLAMVLLDKEERILDINSSFEKLFGYKRKNVYRSYLNPLIADETRIAEANKLSFTVQSGIEKIVNIETVRKRADGSEVYVRVWGFPVFVKNEFSGSFGIYEDLTEQRAKQNQILLLQRAVEQSPLNIIVTNKAGVIEYVNPQFLKTTQYELEEVIGQKPSILKSGKTKKEEYIKLWKTISSGEVWVGEFLNKKKNGEFYWEKTSIAPVKSVDGNITHYIAIKEDVTELKNLQENLSYSENLFRSIWEHSFNGMRLLDENGVIIQVNEAFCRIFEVRKEEILGKMFYDVFTYDDAGIIEKKYRSRFRTKMIEQKFEREVTLWNGKRRWLELTNSVIQTPKQEVLLLSIISDITERKLVEIEITKAKEYAEEMNRLKTVFLSNISHELRTPMIGILGFAEILSYEITTGDAAEMVRTIYKSGKRLLNTINMILDLTRIESAKSEFHSVPINFAEKCASIAEENRSAAEEKDLEYIVKIEEQEIPIFADEIALNQIISSIINNAVKFTGFGSVTISVYTRPEENTKWAYLEVEDTGIGISEENIKFIFDEFRQGSEGINRTYEGMGLGLTIAKKYIELLKGKIYVKSKVNVGSTFTVKFPCATIN